MTKEQRRAYSGFVADLRDTADRDYIVARFASRIGLYQNSAWSGLQAVEKYLKAILLYSNRSVKPYSHDIEKLRAATEKLPKIGFSLPAHCEEIFSYLNEQGPNRYGDTPAFVKGFELIDLDRLVWHVRRYCQDFLLLPGDAQRYPGKAQNRLVAVPGERTWSSSKVFALPGGFLEEVLANENRKYWRLRPHLVWKNFFYGARQKVRIKFTPGLAAKNPMHVLRPKILMPILDSRVRMPKNLRDKLWRLAKAKKKR